MFEAVTLDRPLAGLRRTAARLSERAGALVRAYPRESAGAAVLGVVAALAAGTAISPAGYGPARPAPPPAPPPLTFKPLAPQQAIQVNAEIPIAQGPNPAASPFRFRGSSAARTQALECLASAVYYEAGNQDSDGGRAVAQVVLNRVRHPAFPNSVCSVVYQGSTRATGCQFTFTCDGSLARRPAADGWRRAYRIAEQALAGQVYAPVGWATHYHADYVVPVWAASLAKSAVVGAHLFYRWDGGWGRPAAFNDAYAGREPSAAALRSAALAAPHLIRPLGPQQVAEALKDIPGAQPLAPSMRGDKGVAVRFNLTARKASDEARHEDYETKFDASDNLKWSLSSDSVGDNQKPLGKAAAKVGGTSTEVASVQR